MESDRRIIFTKHAAERLLERNIPIGEIRKMVEKGVRVEDKNSGAILCIYKESQGNYYTLVIDDEEGQVTVITAYESGPWQIERYHKVKKNEHP